MTPPKLLIVTTVPETLATILKHQPAFLARTLAGSLTIELVTSPDPVCDDIALTEELPIHCLRMSRGITPFSDLLSLLAMIRLLLKLKPGIVHSYTPKAGMIAMLASWLCRVPVRIHTFTGLIFPSQTGVKQAVLILIDRLICACASRVVPEGAGVKSDLQKYGITKKPLNVIGHGNIAGVDTAYFSLDADGVAIQSDALARKLNINDGNFVFSFVGRLHRDKGVTELLQAFAGLPQNSRLLLIGAIDDTAPISDQNKAAIATHPRIHALGFLPDIRPGLRLANVLVLPSYREGFPNSVLQAGAMGLPVIATDINGSNEIIEPGFNGWLVPARTVEPLRNAMLAAMQTDPETSLRMGTQARQRVIQRFEQGQHLQRMVAFYRDCLTPSNATHEKKQRSHV